MARHVHIVQNRKALSLMLLIFAFGFVLEAVGGWLTDSLGLISDAFHMLSDGMSQGIFWIVSTILLWSQQSPSWITQKWQQRLSWLFSQPEERLLRFGNGVNLLLLLFSGGYISIFALIRLWEGETTIDSHTSLWIAFIGLLVNGLNLLIYKAYQLQGMKSVYLHILSDLGQSLIVILSLCLISVNERLFWLDGLLSLVLGWKMIVWSWDLAKERWQNKTFTFLGVELRFSPYHPKEACDHQH